MCINLPKNGKMTVDKFKPCICRYCIQLVAKKNGNCQNKIDTFLQFLHSVKPSYER
jgi:hypothetical protein